MATNKHTLKNVDALLKLIATLDERQRAALWKDVLLAADGYRRLPELVKVITKFDKLIWIDDDDNRGSFDAFVKSGDENPIFTMEMRA